MVVDYSKWDDLNTSSSEDEAVTKDAAAATPTLSVFEGHRGPEARERLENPRLGHERKPGVMVLAFADASTVVSGGADSKCRIWDARVGSERLFDTSKRGVLAYAYNTIFSVSVARSRGIVATAAGDGCLRCFDFETGESAAVYDSAGAYVLCSFSPDEQLCACGGFSGEMHVALVARIILNKKYQLDKYRFDVEAFAARESDESDEHRDRASLSRFTTGSDVTALAWIDATTAATVILSGAVVVWDAFSGVELHKIRVPEPGRDLDASIAASPVEPLLAVCSDNQARLYRYEDENIGLDGPRLVPSASGYRITRLAFTPDGLLLATIEVNDKNLAVGRSFVSLYAVASGALERTIDPGSGGPHSLLFVTCLAISTNGRRLAVGRGDARALAYTLDTPASVVVEALLRRAAGASRVSLADDAPRGLAALFRLVDDGKAAVAAYSASFL